MKITLRDIFWLTLCVAHCVVILTTGCSCSQQDDPQLGDHKSVTTPAVPVDVQRVGTVTAAGGNFERNGVKLVFPKDAVPRELPVSIEVRETAEPSPDLNEFLASPAYRLEVGDGSPLTFASDVEVTLPYDPGRLPPGCSEGDLRPMWWTGRAYQPIERFTIDQERNTITLQARHFSDHVVGGDKAKAVKPIGWQPKHPELPVELLVVETYQKDLTNDYLDQLERELAFAYEKLTTGQPYQFLAPGRGPDGKLVVRVTDLAVKKGHATLGVASTPTQMRVKYNLPPDKLRHTVVHEFFHCVQFTHFERALAARNIKFLDGADNRFLWLDEATAEWMIYELKVGALQHSRADFCLEELTYHPYQPAIFQLGADHTGSELHQYASAIFIKFLSEEYGAAIVPALFDAAFGETYFNTPQQLMDSVIQKVAPKAGKIGENLNSTYARFVLEHIYNKRAFGDWDLTHWKLGKRFELPFPDLLPPHPRRAPLARLTPDKELNEAMIGRTCHVPRVFTVTRQDTSRDEQLEVKLETRDKGTSQPAAQLYIFRASQFAGAGDTVTLQRGTAGRATADLLAKNDDHIIIVPVSMTPQTMTLTARLIPLPKVTFAGKWAGKSQRKGIGALDYIATISQRGDQWVVRCGDLSTLVYAGGDPGCTVTVQHETLKATLVDKTVSEGRTTRFTLELMLYDNQINGNEKCEDELADGTDRRTVWENSFMLSRQ